MKTINYQQVISLLLKRVLAITEDDEGLIALFNYICTDQIKIAGTPAKPKFLLEEIDGTSHFEVAFDDLDNLAGLVIDDPMEHHNCKMIAKISPIAEGREIWLGKLLNKIPNAPKETHCLHITTPFKSVVFGIINGDMLALSALATIVNDGTISHNWLNMLAKKYRRAVPKGE